MPTSPLSSARAARAKIAERLKQAMLDAGLNGLELADRCGWHKSKSSRIARGVTPPSDDDIRAWCGACSVPELAADLIAASRTAESMYVEWRQLHRDGMRRVHEKTTPLYQRTRTFRVYASNLVPGMLQIGEYATGLLRSITTFQGTPDDVEQAVAARLARSRVIFEGDHRFSLLLEETVLYYRVCDDAAMAAQLGSLLSVMARPNVSLGIIPFEARRTVWPLEAFYAFDDAQVAVETLTAEINVSGPGEIQTYLRAFNQLSQHALRGAEARSRITRAIDALNAHG
ncbi:XRE family transcriptional regulator [Streptomyces sp. 150FB]|uniref:helix-turn-helix domain-containing protein n=1 Tax=Streptomyces sp. 150FB TaxID=1576605 RepID=UPI0005893CCD|nr:helix-turn-helix transcriptional regulator [Streptomyces sp. 150FB]KIF75240.1 XRE family transcriptional regulator [Streptomyces sp. 150FB]